jgi:hypothetical protein
MGFDDADITIFEARHRSGEIGRHADRASSVPFGGAGSNPASGDMTLREIIASHPELFHPNQTWYQGEAFMEREAKPIETPAFSQWSFPYLFPQQQSQRVSAASLAWAYVRDPNAEVWSKYLWTDDQDSQAQRVYVGGKSNTGKFEIHRHISISSRFGLPTWQS